MAKKRVSKPKKDAAARPPKRGKSEKRQPGDGESPNRVDSTKDAEHESDDFPIVGIGASAGGLAPIKDFLEALPEDPGVAIVVIQHLDPTRKSLAPELLAAHTSMKLCEVVDTPRVRPNSVYVIPPGKYLSISGGELHLSEPDQPRGARMAIDFFLRSLAKDLQQRSVGILMSGGGSDGTLGIKLIKELGGMVMVQDPDTADHESMPQSAIDTGAVDFILSPGKMAEVLVRYAEHPYVRQPVADGEPADQVEAKVDVPGSEVFASILSLLRVRSKHDFRNYKIQTLLRRTRRRMCLAHLDDYTQYLDYLREHPEEIDALVKDLLISVTNFFRDEGAWRELYEQAIIPIVEHSGPGEPIRVWVAGCATGEEPYSLAMLLLDELSRQKKIATIQIFASDIDKDALDYARHSVYPASIQADVSPERMKKYFVKIEGSENYRVGKQVRELVVFAEQNLIGDPPFSKLHLICCRNLLIYLKPDVQEKVISLFHFALNDGGYLFLGTAETVGRQSDLFRALNKRWRIFRRIGPTRPERVEIPVSSGVPRREIAVHESRPADLRESRLAHLANQSMVDWLSPSAILIDDRWSVLYIHGNVDKYMQHTQGVPKDDLLEKARRGLRIKLRTAVHRAFEEEQAITADAQVEVEGAYRPVRILVRPIHDVNSERKLALVLFDDGIPHPIETVKEDRPEAADSSKADRAAPKAGRGPAVDSDLDEHMVIQQLEQELANTKEDLQGTLEQFEAANEEFKAANEEVMSINEELQSTNEELETSKEELQSLNEELSTVNNQLAAKVEELETQHADLKNLVGATDVATVCLDRDVRIRWFTPAATRVIRLHEADSGRPLSDFAHDFDNDDFGEVARQVLRTLMPMQDEVTCHDNRTYLRRVLPYRTEDDHIGGVIMTFIDISERKKSELALAEREKQLRELAKSLEDQVEHRISALKVLHDITMAANEARSFDAAIKAALDKICQYNGWVLGHAWRNSGHDLVSARVWQYNGDTIPHDFQFDTLRQASERVRLPITDKFIGEVIRTGRPVWVANLDEEPNWVREIATGHELKSAIAFPVILKGEVVAVLEFFSNKPIHRDDRFMEIMPQVGVQLGHVLERKRLEREVALVADTEQQRMGQEMHDGLSQQIAGISMLAGSLADNLKSAEPALAGKVDKLLSAIEDAKQQARALSKGLLHADIESHGLRPTLEELAERTQNTYGIQCTLEESDHLPVVESFTATHLYRIAREAIHNAVKHAKAKQIWIRLTNGGVLTLVIQDDGVGVDKEHIQDGDGIRIMRHRAELIGASFSIRRADAGGTVVSCEIGGGAGGRE